MQRQLLSRRSLLHSFAAALTAAPYTSARAGPGAAESLRILCIGSAGSPPDTIARAYAGALSGDHGNAVIVDNRPGAGGQIAIGALRRVSADGSTMLLAHGSVVTVYPHLYARLAYAPRSDLTAVSLAGEIAFGLALGPAVPDEVRNLADFIAWAHAHPADCNYGSPGVGTLPHLLGALLFWEEQIRAQHVTYSSMSSAISDELGGRLAASMLPEGQLRTYYAAGRLRAVATTSETRSRFMPDVPTFAELKHPGLVAREWFGFFMPGATPRPLVERMSQAVQVAAQTPHVQAALGEFAIHASSASPQIMDQRIEAERRQWQGSIRALGLRLE